MVYPTCVLYNLVTTCISMFSFCSNVGYTGSDLCLLSVHGKVWVSTSLAPLRRYYVLYVVFMYCVVRRP